MRLLIFTLFAAILASGAPASAQDRVLIPERRAVLTENTDLPGADIRQIFDTTLEACEQACLSDADCKAFTFNTRSNACFPKSAVSEQAFYQGAYSGWIRQAAPGAAARAKIRAAELTFLSAADFSAALSQARGLVNQHVTGDQSAEALLSASAQARANGDYQAAMRLQGAALNLTDKADQWLEYARLLLEIDSDDIDVRRDLATRALTGSLNAYLRAENAGLRATALATIAQAMERVDRGRDMIPALRLAQSLQPRDDTGAMLQDAIGKYGFRITEHEVQSDTARPRVCAVFSEDLVRAGTDYAPFVKLADTGLSVEASGRQLCVSGVEHGRRYTITFRAGLPAENGETLAKDVTLNLYVRDRTAAVRFPGRAYILPRAAKAGIPVETVNTDSLELTLLRVSDRNLIRAIQSDYFGRPLDYWSGQGFRSEVAEEVWKGKADVSMQINRDMLTRLPLDDVMGDLGPGIYALPASVPGLDPYDNPPATQWFVISDIGLTTLSGVDGLHVFTRSLADVSASAGSTVTLISRANAIIGETVTDAEGYARFTAAQTAGTGGAAPALVTVAKGDDFTFLSLTEAEFDLSDRGVAGHEPAPPIDIFLATDRGAYRAGETVNATILARDARVQGIEGLPLTARLIRPDGVEYARALLQEAGAGGHTVSLPLAGSAPRGTWRIDVFAEESRTLASQSFLVEDFLPERIDFTLALPEGPIRLSDTPSLAVEARYLFGVPGADLAIEGDYRIAATDGLEAFPGYRFGRYDEPFSPHAESLAGAGRTDADGKALIPLVFPDLGDAANRPLRATFTLRLKEGSGRPVERQIARQILPATPVIGLKPGFDGGVVPEGDAASFDIIAVGPDLSPAAMQVHWTVNRVEKRYQWYALYGQWNWDVTTTRTRIAEGDLALTGDGPQRLTAPVESGNYELVVESRQGAYSASSMAFDAGWYAPANAVDTPDTLDVSLDKPAYRPGDTAVLRLVPRAAGVALVTVMSNRLIDMKAVAVSEGDNRIPLKVTDDWGAGAYVAASVLRPMDVAAGRTPERALGLSYAPVDPGARRLNVSFDMPSAADPRGPLPVTLKVDGVAAGETAYATIAAVDVGILNLTGYKAPDPADHYFGQRKLGVAIRDIYGRLIDGQNGAMGKIRSGGDAASGLKMQSPPPTEELVAYFSGPVKVGQDGFARTEFSLPSFNGTVRLMAVAWSQSGIGQGDTDVLVRDPVAVTASLPRFLSPGDESRLLLEFVHTSGPSGRMGLDVTGKGVTLGLSPSGIDLSAQGKVTLSVPVTAGLSDEAAELRVALTTPDGHQLVKTLILPIEANDPGIARQSRFELAAGQSFTLDANAFAGLNPGSGKAILSVGPIARFNAPGLIAALDRYPYGCTEQLTSKALPLLYFDEVARALGGDDAKDVGTRVDQSIAKILLNQSANGAFGLWDADSGDLWLDAYVSDFLSRARARGHAVPDTAFRNAMDNLRNQLNYAADFDRDGGPVAYALMVLAREGAAAIGDLRYYADVKADAFDTPIAAAQLGAALASYGDQTRADAMFTQAARLVAANALSRENRLWRADYGTNLRDATALLALASEAGSSVINAETLGDAIAAGMAGHTLSTQEATWALLATNALIDRPGSAGFTVNGQPVTGPLIRVLEDQTAGGSAQIITNGSAKPATVTLTTFGVPTNPEPAGGNGYAITRSWYTLQGEAVDPANIKQGSRLVTVIEVTPNGGGEARLMINDPLPAGFEIDNPNLLRGGDIAALGWLDTEDNTRMTEFRQDRFLAALDWTSDNPFRLAYIVRAVSPGSFHLPAASVEDMYRPDFRARSDSGRVTVAE